MKRLTAVVIALLLFVSVMLPAQAATSCDCGKTPLVVVGGMNGNPLIIDKGTPNERQIWAPPIDAGQVALTAARGNTHGPGCLDGEAPNLRGIASGFHRAVLRGMRMARCSNGRSSGAAINRNRPATAFRGKLRCRGRNFPDDVVFNALPSEWRCK